MRPHPNAKAESKTTLAKPALWRTFHRCLTRESTEPKTTNWSTSLSIGVTYVSFAGKALCKQTITPKLTQCSNINRT